MNQESQVQSSLFHTYFENRLHEMKAYFASLVKEYEAVLTGQIRDPREIRRLAREYAAIAANREASELFPYDVSPRAEKLYALAESLDGQASAVSSHQTDDGRHTELPRRAEVYTVPGNVRTDEPKEKVMITDTSPIVFDVTLNTSDDILYAPLSFLSEQAKPVEQRVREGIAGESDEIIQDGIVPYEVWKVMFEWIEEAESLYAAKKMPMD